MNSVFRYIVNRAFRLVFVLPLMLVCAPVILLVGALVEAVVKDYQLWKMLTARKGTPND